MEIQWSLVLFATFICWGAGTYLMAVVFSEVLKIPRRIVRPAFVFTAIAVIIGAVASMTHLGHLDRIFGVLSNPTSGIFVEGVSSALLVILIVVYLVAAFRKAAPAILRAIAFIGIIPAFVVVFAVGSSYLMVARPAWNVAALPMVSLTGSLSLGSITVLAINAFAAKASGIKESVLERRTSAVALSLLGIQAVGIIAYVMSVATAPYQDASRSAARMLFGDLAPLFWIFVVVLGIVVPCAATLGCRRLVASSSDAAVGLSKTAAVMLLAVACMVIAVAAFRIIMFLLGSSIIDFEFTI